MRDVTISGGTVRDSANFGCNLSTKVYANENPYKMAIFGWFLARKT